MPNETTFFCKGKFPALQNLLGEHFPSTNDPLESLGSTLRILKDRPHLRFRTLPILARSHWALFENEEVTPEEIRLADQIAVLWAGTAMEGQPIQCAAPSSQLINQHLVRERNAFVNWIRLYSFSLRKRVLGLKRFKPRLLDRIRFAGATAYGLTESTKSRYSRYLSKFNRWVRKERFYHEVSLLSLVLEFSLKELRLRNSWFQELCAWPTFFDLEDLCILFIDIMPFLDKSTPRAAASAIGLLNEHVALAPIIANIGQGNFSGAVSDLSEDEVETLDLALRSFPLEADLWRLSGDTINYAHTRAAWQWMLFELSGRENPKEIIDLVNETIRKCDLRELEEFSTVSRLLALEVGRSVFISGSGSELHLGSKAVDNRTVFETVAGILAEDSLHPASMPFETPYRSILRAELTARPPHLVHLSGLCYEGKHEDALHLAFSLQSRRRDDALTQMLQLKSSPKEIAPMRLDIDTKLNAWADEVATRGIELQGTQRVSDDAFERIHRLHGVNYGGSIAELRYHDAKWNLLRTVAETENRSAETGKLSEYDTGTRLDMLTTQAKKRNVDLLYLGLGDGGILALHFRPRDDKWVSAEFLPEASLPTMQGVAAGSWESGDWNALVGVAERISEFLIDLFSFGESLCLLADSAVAHFPVAAILARDLETEDGKTCAVAETPILGASYSSRRSQQFKSSFKVFVAPEMVTDVAAKGEILWGELGMVGSVEAVLSRQACIEALTENLKVVHFATHGYFDKNTPLFSGIQLSEEWLTGLDLLCVEIDSRLVVLNCCNTATAGVFSYGAELDLATVIVRRGAEMVLGNRLPIDSSFAAEYAAAFQDSLGSQDGTYVSPAGAYSNSVVKFCDSNHEWYSMMLRGQDLDVLFSAW